MNSHMVLAAAGDTHPAEWLLTWVVLGAVVLAALLFEGAPVTLWFIAAAMVAGLVALGFGHRRVAALLIAAADVVFLVWASPYLLRAVTTPVSSLEYVAAAIFLIIAVASLIGARLIWSEGSGTLQASASTMPLAVAAGMSIVALAVTFAGVTRLLTEDIAPTPSDFVLQAEELWYSTSEITLRAGELDLMVDNADLGMHSFVIDDLDVVTVVPGGVARRVVFSAPVGTYTYYCNLPGHDTMRGTLTVLENF
jgi:uncharacterized cupredoxin-like copper-binding protein